MVSIIILAYNNIEYTRQCLDSVFLYTSQAKSPFEVIVVDNASTDGTKEYLQGLEKSGMIRAIYNAENVGFPKGNNQSAEIAQGEYLCLLNNDTIVTAGWLEKMLRCIKSDSSVAIVGPYCNASSGNNASPIPCNYNNPIELQKFAERFSQEDKYVNFLVFFCALIKRSEWDEIGGLWSGYGVGCFEDNELCYKVIEKGYKMKVAGNCFVHHYISKTFSPDKPKKDEFYKKLLAHNQKLFLNRICKYKTVGLSMICADSEKPEVLRRCLKSIAPVVDSINIVFNYKDYPKPWRIKKLLAVVKEFENIHFDNTKS
jgi:GT2 family glycosyltransferase